jgi:hypothetical protein
MEVALSKTNISEKIRYLLWAKSAGRCEFNGCNEPLYSDNVTQIEMNFAEVAHIIGDSPRGPRGEITLSQEYCDNISNLMLMCPKHHKMIDQITQNYSVEILRQMKQDHESRIRILTNIKPNKTSNLIIYRGNIGSFQPAIEYREALIAMQPQWYPASHLAYEIGMLNSLFHDDEKRFWEIETENLERQFRDKIQGLLGRQGQRNHFSIFAFAPIPLLIKLGSLIPDIYPAQVYQLKKEPQSWEWQPAPERFDYLISEPQDNHPTVALNLSLSADITEERIYQALGRKSISIWRMDISETIFPKNDHLRSAGQLTLFSRKFRKMLDQIKAKHGQETILHVFPAIPVSIAVEIGRVRQAKADLPFLIYDQNNKTNGFTPTIKIE